MKKLVTLLLVLVLCVTAFGSGIDLKTAGDFGALAGSGITSSGLSIIIGNVGSSPTPAVNGFPPGVVVGTLYLADNAVTTQAKLDLTDAYNTAMNTAGGVLESGSLNGEILGPGVYMFLTSVGMTNTLTLDGGGNSNAVWIFQIPSTLTTSSDFSLLLINGASASNVYWQVGSSATIGINSNFSGNIMALTSITLNGGILNGRALACNGAVTMSTAVTIRVPAFVPPPTPIIIPEVNTPGVPDENNTSILVYRVAIQGSLLEFIDTNNADAEMDTSHLCGNNMVGYVVMDVNVLTLNNPAIDANNEPIFIIQNHCDNQFAIVRESTDSNVSIDCTLASTAEPIFNLRRPETNKDTGVDAVWAKFNLAVKDNIVLSVSGTSKLSLAAVGRDGAKIDVPCSITGAGGLAVATCSGNEYLHTYYAKGSCLLDKKYTKLANAGKLSTYATARMITSELIMAEKTVYELYYTNE